jgi:hypothetical protein
MLLGIGVTIKPTTYEMLIAPEATPARPPRT